MYLVSTPEPPAVESLPARVREFWIPGQTVVYIGLAGTSLGIRVGQFYRTPLGDRGPHAGGHWPKALDGLDTCTITWAETATSDEHEDALLRALDQGRRPLSIAIIVLSAESNDWATEDAGTARGGGCRRQDRVRPR